MSKVRDFIIGLAKSGMKFKDIKKTVKAAYPGEELGRSQIYKLIKLAKAGGDGADLRGRARTRWVTDADFIEAVRADVEADPHLKVAELAEAYNVSVSTMHRVLTVDLGLSKKVARWIPIDLNPKQKEARKAASDRFLDRYENEKDRFLGRTVTMDETMMAYYTPQTKRASKEWSARGAKGPLKVRLPDSRRKQMVMAFFDCRGLIYTNIVPRGVKVNGAYIVKALTAFWKHLGRKRPDLAAHGFNFHWDNAPVHKTRDVADFLAAKAVTLIEHPPYSPDLAPADFWLFPTVKERLGGIHIAPTDLKKTWEGVTADLAAADYAAAFQDWIERHKKCQKTGGNNVEKS